MNRRTAFLLLLAFACAKEKPAPPASTSEPVPATRQAPPAAQAAPAPPSAPASGSYEDAVRRFRIAPKLAFTYTDGDGSLQRPRQGMESVQLNVTKGADRGKWTADVKPNGVVWTKDGKHAEDVPASLQRLYQFLVFYPDPQKKEGAPRPTGAGYEFTDANGGDRYVVQLAKDGSIAEVRINSWRIAFR